MEAAAAKARAEEVVAGAAGLLTSLAHEVHAHPELRFEEHRAAAWLGGALADAGLHLDAGAGGLPTAFVARAGSGPLHVAVCAEYDALPGLGHACGHNLIGAAAVGAGLALAALADDLGLTVSVVGCPGEEGGGGKALLLDAGVFDGAHLAMMVHPFGSDVLLPPHIAVEHWEVAYEGRAAHASSRPQAGVNAADALTIAQTAIGLLRQHLSPKDRVHGIVTHGGDAANIVPALTTAEYYVRSRTGTDLDRLVPRVRACFEAGAVATGCTLAIHETSPRYLDLRHHQGLAAAYRRNAEALGREFVEAPQHVMERFAGSTDMGNVSHVVPSIHPMIGIESHGASTHEAAFTEATASPSADRAVVEGAVAMAWTAIDAALDPSLRTALLA